MVQVPGWELIRSGVCRANLPHVVRIIVLQREIYKKLKWKRQVCGQPRLSSRLESKIADHTVQIADLKEKVDFFVRTPLSATILPDTSSFYN